MPTSNQGKIANGAIWMVLFKLVERSLGLVSTLILVRVLSPHDFGIVAMAISLLAMVELLTAFGFDVALIRERNATPEHYHTAWTFGLLFAAAVTAVMALGAPLASMYFREPAVKWVVWALALGPLITAAQNIGVVAFRKELRFRNEFNFQISRKLVGFSITIPLAIWLQSYWALVAGMLATQLFSTGISYWAHPFRPRFSLAARASLMGFSQWMLLGNMLNYFKERSPDWFVGRLMGPASLGVYNVSFEFANMPTTELSAPINRALLPGFASLSGDPARLRTLYASAMGTLALLALPAATGIFALAHLIVPVVLGPKWAAAVGPMQILAFNGALLMLHSSICAVLFGTGHPKDVSACTAVYVVIFVALLLALTPTYGLEGAAAAALGTSILSTPVYLWALRRRLGLQIGLFIAALRRPTLGAGFMSLVLYMVLPRGDDSTLGLPGLVWILGGIAVGAVVYIAAVLAMWVASGRPEGAERLLIDRVRLEIRRRFPGSSSTSRS